MAKQYLHKVQDTGSTPVTATNNINHNRDRKMQELTAEQVYVTYSVAVGGASYDNKPLPPYDALGDRQKEGWEAVALLISNS